MADQDKLEQLSDRHSGAAQPEPSGGEAPDVSASDQSSDKASSGENATSGDPMDAAWEPLTLYLLDDVHTSFNKPFFMRLQLEHEELQEFMKRELQQAAIEVAMRYEDDVVEQAKELHETLDENGEKDDETWEPLTVYLVEDVHREFNKPFFMRLQLEHEELQEYMKRELQQAAVEVAMEHEGEVAERAKELHAELT